MYLHKYTHVVFSTTPGGKKSCCEGINVCCCQREKTNIHFICCYFLAVPERYHQKDVTQQSSRMRRLSESFAKTETERFVNESEMRQARQKTIQQQYNKSENSTLCHK